MKISWETYEKKMINDPSNDCNVFFNWFNDLKAELAPDMDDERFLNFFHFADRKTLNEKKNGKLETRHDQLAKYLKELIEWLPL